MKKKVIFILIILLFSISINIYYYSKKDYNKIIENSLDNAVIGSGLVLDNSLDNNYKYSIFEGQELNYTLSQKNKIKELCSKSVINFYTIEDFKKNNEDFFKKVFLGFDENKYLSDFSEKDGFYFYDNCNFIPVNRGVYGECIIRTNLKHIFLRDGLKVINLDIFPYDFLELQNNVVLGKCNLLKNHKIFSDFYESCKSKDVFIEKLNLKTKKLIDKLCKK